MQELENIKRMDTDLHTSLQVRLSSYICSRTWLTNLDAKALKETVLELVNIRNLTYSSFRSFYKDCKDYSSDQVCYLLYRSPFFLHWAFPSVLICHRENNQNQIVLRLFISFEAVLERIMIPNQPIGRTVSVLGEAHSGNENRFVKLLSPNMRKPEITIRAATLKMKDFHHIYPSYTAVAKMAVELVTWCNLSIIFPNQTNPYDEEVLVMGVFPRLYANAILSNNLKRGIYYERPMDVSTLKTDYNFMYCDVPHKGQANIWDFSPLLYPFEKYVWFAMIVAILLISILTLFGIHIDGYFFMSSTTTGVTYIHTFFSIVSSLVSVLITGPCYFGLKFALDRSLLFVTWLFVSLMLTNFYTGLLTSVLMQPIPDKTLGTLKELVDHGYSVIFGGDSPNVFETVMESVKLNKVIKMREGNQSSHTTDFDLLEVLITDKPQNQYFPDAQFIEKAAFDRKSVVFGAWLYIYWIFQRTMGYIESKGNFGDGNENSRITCHVGKKLLPSAPLFWGFYPPNVEWLYETHLGFVQNGIEGLWLREFYGLNYAKRVQDRAKVLSETEVAPDPESMKPKPIKFDDSHFITVVMLGIVCMMISGGVFLTEVFCSRVFSRTDVIEITSSQIYFMFQNRLDMFLRLEFIK